MSLDHRQSDGKMVALISGPEEKAISKKPLQKEPLKNTSKNSVNKLAANESSRSSTRKSVRGNRDNSADPLSLAPTSPKGHKASSRLFSGMIFAVSCDDLEEKNMFVNHIRESGGGLLEEGFVGLFKGGPKPGQIDKPDLVVAANKRSLGFAAVIASEHSRKPKYMQALALGLPCLSGHWILSCICKGAIVDWKTLPPFGWSVCSAR